MTLQDLGWNDVFAREFAPWEAKGCQPARLVRDNRIAYGALIAGTEDLREVEAMLAGKVLHEAQANDGLPAVGDWVALELASDGKAGLIHGRLTRQSCLSRRATGESEVEQVIAANVSTVVVVTDAGADFNVRRMERFFALIARCGAKAVVLLNKADLFSDTKNSRAAKILRGLQADAQVEIVSAKTRKGLGFLRACLHPGGTVAFIGSSGVGKSALINRLLDEDSQQWTGSVNETTGKGRHTTTARELMVLPNGSAIIDNPGIKDLQMWTDERTLRESFSDIQALATQCQFDNCQHAADTGCAIRAAVAQGALKPERLAAYMALDGQIKKLGERRKEREQIVERRSKINAREKSREWVRFGGEREDEWKNKG
jgi:ribosome biogenesis GTPase